VPKSQDRPGQVFEFVLDLDRYRQEDHRVGRVGPVKRDGSGGTAVSSGRIGGLPEPSGTYPFTLTPTSQRFISEGAQFVKRVPKAPLTVSGG